MRRGAVTVELAIILPAILLLLLGALEFGRVFQAWVVAHNAAREGARHAALGFNANQVREQVVLLYLQESGLGGDMGVSLPTAEEIIVEIGAPGEPVSVHVPVWVEVNVPALAQLLPSNPFRVGATSTMRRQ